MANNALLGDAGMGATFLGGITSAISSAIGGQDQQQMFNYQAGVATLNAQISRQNATYATQVGRTSSGKCWVAGWTTFGKDQGRARSFGAGCELGIEQTSADLTSRDHLYGYHRDPQQCRENCV